MPDLGRYAVEVLSAYGMALGLLGALVGLTAFKGRQVRRRLADAEARRRG
ncbi:heme exporter protein CcmD [Oceaniovalibus guishaninsula]